MLDDEAQQARAARFADALEKYAQGLTGGTSSPPDIALSSSSLEKLSGSDKQEQCVMQQMIRLPDWTHTDQSPAREPVQGVSQL